MLKKIKNKVIGFFEKTFKKIKEFFCDLLNIKSIGFKTFCKTRLISIIVLFSIIIISLFSITQLSIINKDELLNNFKKALIEKNASKLANYVKIDGKRADKKELESIINFYGNNTSNINNIVDDLRKSNENNIFYLNEKNTIFGNDNWIDIKKVDITFSSNVENLEVYFDNNKINLKNNKAYSIIPGTYDASYKLKTDYGDVDGKFQFSAIENKNINIDVPVQFITLYSNFDDAKVFINGVDIGKSVGDIKSFGPLPIDKNLKIFIQRDFPWGSIKSSEYVISDDQYIKLDINMVNDELMNMITTRVDDFYSSVFDALNNKSKDLIENSTEEVKDKVYDYINENALIFKNNYEITDLEVQIEKSDFIYEDNKYKAALITNINYNVYKKVMPFLKTPYNSTFLLSLIYEEEQWRINDIQKIDISIN